MKTPINIVLGTSTLADYPEGGGHWSVFLQYIEGLRHLGHNVFLLERYNCTGKAALDEHRAKLFLSRMSRMGLRGSCAIIAACKGAAPREIQEHDVIGIDRSRLMEVIRDADILWDFHDSLGAGIVQSFRRKAFIDLDPGQMQLAAAIWDIDFGAYDAFLTVGAKIGDKDCRIPTLGRTWYSFFPPVHLPAWSVTPSNHRLPITSVTQWNWNDEAFQLDEVELNTSKREAYLRYLKLPGLCSARFVLAANIHPLDDTGDRELLREHGWKLVDPNKACGTVKGYARFLSKSAAEISCAKSIFTGLRTGWFSDRSAAYLASGRPVIAEDTGFSDHIETGLGLLAFSGLDQAAAAVDALLSNYASHCRAARALAEERFSAARVLRNMLACSL